MAKGKKSEENTGVFIFTGFYESMLAIEDLSLRWELFDAVFNFGLTGEEVCVHDSIKPVFAVMKPFLKRQIKVVQERKVLAKKRESGNYASKNSSKTKVAATNCSKTNIQVGAKTTCDSSKICSCGGEGVSSEDNSNLVGSDGDSHTRENKNKNKKNKTNKISNINNSLKQPTAANKNKSDNNGPCDSLLGNSEKNRESSCVLSAAEAAACEKNLKQNAVSSCKVVKPQVNFPPTLKEVEEFAEKAMIGFNVRQFYYYYESNGWLEGGEKIRDWKRCLISWQRSRDVRQFAAQEDYKIIREEKEAKLKEAASRYDFENIYDDLDELIAEIDAKTEKENRENGENKKPDYSSIWD